MSNETEQRSGWWIEFKRGWWLRSNPPHQDHIERGQGSGHYSGNVTEEQAKALEKIVNDYLTSGDQPPRLTAYGMREFIGRAIAYWKSQPGERAEKEAAEMAAMLAPRPEVAPQFVKLVWGADEYELCRFDSGEWSMRSKLVDGDVAHRRYLTPFEANLLDTALALRSPQKTWTDPQFKDWK